MNKAPRYLLTDQFDLGMLSSLTADITLTEISLEHVCQLIEAAEFEQKLACTLCAVFCPPAYAAFRRGSLRFHYVRAKAGGLAGTRTPDQCLKRAMLYQLSYQPSEDVGK